MDPINASVIALHGALIELTLRLGRVEDALQVTPGPLATFGRVIPPPQYEIPKGPQHAPSPDYTSGHGAEPCGCEESVALHARIAELTARLEQFEGGRDAA